MNSSDSENTSCVAASKQTDLREQVQQLQKLPVGGVAGDLAATALEEAALARGKRVGLLLGFFLLVGVATRWNVLGLHARLVRRVCGREGLGRLRLDHRLVHLVDQQRRLILELAGQKHHELLDEVVVPSEQVHDLDRSV